MENATFDQQMTTTMLFLAAFLLFLAGCVIWYIFWPAWVGSRRLDEPTETVREATKNGVVLLTVVIPAYNEEDRLDVMLQDAYDYLSQSPCSALEILQSQQQKEEGTSASLQPKTVAAAAAATIEWILVSDGSTDRTIAVYHEFIKRCYDDADSSSIPKNTNSSTNKHNMTWKTLTLTRNSGKGAAVQAGMNAGNGQYLLFCDADGATKFRGLYDCARALTTTTTTNNNTQQPGVALGSRAHLQESSQVQRSALRTILMHGFHLLQHHLVGTGSIRDTQCGFKLFHASAARTCFCGLHLQRWGFDMEVVYICTRAGIPLGEVPVEWTEIDGSKLHTSPWSLIQVSLDMLRDMLCVRLCYALGIWKIRQQAQQDSSRRRGDSSEARRKTD